MKLLGINPQQSDRIQIVPVANGFVVYLPIVSGNEFGEVLQELGKGIQKLSGDEDEILANAKRQMEDEQREESARDLSTFSDKHCYIFKTFNEVLAFLKTTYDK
jgi:hypothetical protein